MKTCAAVFSSINCVSFENWNTYNDGSGTTYQPGDSIVMTENVTLYGIHGDIPVDPTTITGFVTSTQYLRSTDTVGIGSTNYLPNISTSIGATYSFKVARKGITDGTLLIGSNANLSLVIVISSAGGLQVGIFNKVDPEFLAAYNTAPVPENEITNVVVDIDLSGSEKVVNFILDGVKETVNLTPVVGDPIVVDPGLHVFSDFTDSNLIVSEMGIAVYNKDAYSYVFDSPQNNYAMTSNGFTLTLTTSDSNPGNVQTVDLS